MKPNLNTFALSLLILSCLLLAMCESLQGQTKDTLWTVDSVYYEGDGELTDSSLHYERTGKKMWNFDFTPHKWVYKYSNDVEVQARICSICYRKERLYRIIDTPYNLLDREVKKRIREKK